MLEIPGRPAPWAVEVRLGTNPTVSRGFHEALKDVRPERALVAYGGDGAYPLLPGVEVVSLPALCQRLLDLR